MYTYGKFLFLQSSFLQRQLRCQSERWKPNPRDGREGEREKDFIFFATSYEKYLWVMLASFSTFAFQNYWTPRSAFRAVGAPSSYRKVVHEVVTQHDHQRTHNALILWPRRLYCARPSCKNTGLLFVNLENWTWKMGLNRLGSVGPISLLRSRTRPQHSIGNFRLSFRLWILKKKQKSISKLTKNDFGEKLIFAIHSMGSLHRLWIPFLMSWIPFDSLDGFDGSPYRLHWSLYRF